MQTIVKIEFGSQLYGTSTPSSDVDYKGVYLPSSKDILLQRVQGSLTGGKQKAAGVKNFPGELDQEFYSLQRYLSLLAEGQTVAIDMLFARYQSLLYATDTWYEIRANRRRLLTKKSAAFVGYCRTQANKYGIKGSRVAAARKAAELFAFELAKRGPSAKVDEVTDALQSILDEHTAIVAQRISNDETTGNFFECCNRKVAFNATIKQAHEVYSRIYENYGKRAQQAEQNQGIDWKALSHAVRVGHEALELLQTENITFPLFNAKHILRIKQGELPYEAVAEEIEKLLEDVEEAAKVSSLPDHADTQFIDNFVEAAYYDAVRYR